MAGGDWLRRLVDGLRAHEEKRTTPLPRYERLQEIARGGMGVVHLAWDRRMNREVALKVLPSRDPESIERFQREIALVADLSHPHIVPVHDSGVLDGEPYFAMRLIDGPSIDRAGLSAKDALARVRDAARAVHHAHLRGVIHRDLKPSNLLLDGQGVVYVADFGVARRSGDDAPLTLPGLVLGTPAYMPPEQARGLKVDERSDVYSLGATLYELLCGRAPYAGATAGDVLEALLAGPPAPPETIRPDLSLNAAAILRKAMERDPRDRYASAEEFAADIDLYLSGHRPTARETFPFFRVVRFLRRHPWRSAGIATSAALFLIVLSSALGLGWAWNELESARREPHAVHRLRRLRSWPCRLLPESRDLEEAAWSDAFSDVRALLKRRSFRDAKKRVDELLQLDARRAVPLRPELAAAERTAFVEELELGFQRALEARDLPLAETIIDDLKAQAVQTLSFERALDELRALLHRERLETALKESLEGGSIDRVRVLYREARRAVPDVAAELRPRVLERERDELAIAAESGDVGRFDAVDLDGEDGVSAQASGLARGAAAFGSWAAAAEILQGALAREPDDPGARRDLARYFVAARDWSGAERAVSLLDPAHVRADPELAPLWRRRASEAEARNDLPGELDALTVVRLRAPEADDLLRLAEVLLLSGKPEEAWLAQLREALLARPSRAPRPELLEAATRHATAALALAPFETRQTRWRGALGDVEPLLLRLEPKPRELLKAWAALKRRLGEGEAAHQLLEKQGLPLEEGLILYSLGKSKAALERFRAAGGDARAKLWRAYADGGTAALEEARAAGAAGIVLSLRLAEARIRDKRFDGALELTLENGAFTPDDWLASGGEAAGEDPARVERRLRLQLLRPRAEAQLALGDPDGCVKTCGLALQEGAQDLVFRLLRARARLPSLKRGSPRDVVDDLQAYLAGKPEDLAARMDLGLAFYRLGNYQASEDEYGAVIQARDDWAAAWYSRGRARKALGNDVAALSDFRDARRLPLTPELKALLDLEPK